MEKKLKPIEILAKIKYMLKTYYKASAMRPLGRNRDEFTGSDAIELVESIDDILSEIEIPKKYLIVEEFENEYKKK